MKAVEELRKLAHSKRDRLRESTHENTNKVVKKLCGFFENSADSGGLGCVLSIFTLRTKFDGKPQFRVDTPEDKFDVEDMDSVVKELLEKGFIVRIELDPMSDGVKFVAFWGSEEDLKFEPRFRNLMSSEIYVNKN